MEEKVHKKLTLEAAVNKICVLYVKEKNKTDGKVKYNTLSNIIKKVKKIITYFLILR